MPKKHKTPQSAPTASQDRSTTTADQTNADREAQPSVAGPTSALSGDFDIGSAHVVESSEAGGYYCEHTLFGTLQAASEPGSSVVEGDGGPLAGFLHVPDDPQTYEDAEVTDQAARHQQTRQVVAAALRGYFDQISLRGGVADGEPFRILLTGYGAFQDSIQNNPTGDFVVHVENITAAMQVAFGPALLAGPEQVDAQRTDRFVQEAIRGGAEVAEYYTATWRFKVLEPATCDTREVLVTAVRLPVTDQAIDPNRPGSVQDAMDEFGPQAVLSMGVVPDRDYSEQTYRAETRADDENLTTVQDLLYHKRGVEPRTELQSRGLVNALRDGSGRVSGTP